MEGNARGFGSNFAFTLGESHPASQSAAFGNDSPRLLVDSKYIFLYGGNERLNDDRRLKRGHTLCDAGIAGADGARQGRACDVRRIIAKAVLFGDALAL
jgi:hypothetical protein